MQYSLKKPLSKNHGFTLLELILAIVVLGLAAIGLIWALKDFAEGSAATTTTYEAAGTGLCLSYWGTTGIGKTDDLATDEERRQWEQQGLSEEQIKQKLDEKRASKLAKCLAEVKAEALRATAAQEKFDISKVKCVPTSAWPENLVGS